MRVSFVTVSPCKARRMCGRSTFIFASPSSSPISRPIRFSAGLSYQAAQTLFTK